jgi:hypothetical protein
MDIPRAELLTHWKRCNLKSLLTRPTAQNHSPILRKARSSRRRRLSYPQSQTSVSDVVHVLEKSIIDSEDVEQGADWSDFSAKACTFLLQPGFQGVLAGVPASCYLLLEACSHETHDKHFIAIFLSDIAKSPNAWKSNER